MDARPSKVAKGVGKIMTVFTNRHDLLETSINERKEHLDKKRGVDIFRFWELLKHHEELGLIVFFKLIFANKAYLFFYIFLND